MSELVDRLRVTRAKQRLRDVCLALDRELAALPCGQSFASNLPSIARLQSRAFRYVRFLRDKGEPVPRMPEWVIGQRDHDYDRRMSA